jgi:hypothetical protein
MKQQLALIGISLGVIMLSAVSTYVIWLMLRGILPDVGVAVSLVAWVVVFAAGSRLLWVATDFISVRGRKR